MNLVEILDSWSFWDRKPSPSVTRDCATPRELSPRLALVTKGVRRAGKSTFMQQLMPRYGLAPKHCIFVNFEDPRLAGHLDYRLLQAIVDTMRAAHGARAKLTYFLDEIQWVSGWQKWLRTQLERPSNCSFVITGSNAQLLSGELGSALTGRHISIELYPFSFGELLKVKRRLTTRAAVVSGGFPEVVASKDSDVLLRQYFHDIVERDVRERVGARSSHALRQMVQMVFESAGAELSVRRVAAATHIAVDTAQDYLAACESAYLLFGCQFFAHSERKRAAYNKKYYPIDTALRRIAISRTGLDLGKQLECATYLALRRAYPQVYYWRGRGEVDFVVQDRDGSVTPIQVSWRGKEPRHQLALDDFYGHFPQAKEAVWISANTFADWALSLAPDRSAPPTQ